jgi:osmotically-inducible protein OsmY
MDKRLLLVPVLCTMLSACDQNASQNVADANMDNSMMMDQTQPDSDNMITQKINNWLMTDSSLSANARNIQVSTKGGVVTLDGMVSGPDEKNKIMNYAQNTYGVQGINDRLRMTNFAPPVKP